MNIKTKLIRVFLLLAVLVLPTSSAYAQSPGGDVVLFGQNYTLAKGEELNGSLAVLGGNITIEEGATVTGDIALIGGNFKMDGDAQGDVAVIGGNLTISGTVDGDVVIIGGQVQLTATAVVNGGITTVGGQLDRDPEAQVNGEIVNNAPPSIEAPDVPNVPNTPGVPGAPGINISLNPFWEVAQTIGFAVIVAAIGMLLMLFLQPQLERVGDAVVRQPLMAGSFGLLTVVLAPLALLIMVITIILIPVAAIVLFVLLPIAWLFGVIAIGQEVGNRFTEAIKQTWAPVLSTGFGTFLVMFIGGLVGMFPCVGWLVPFTIALMGIGGVLMTWFGTRSAAGSQPQAIEVPPAS